MLLVAGVVVGWSTLRALEARRDVAGANDLRLAAAEVVSAEAVQAAGGDIDGFDLAGAIDRMTGNNRRALAHLAPIERSETTRLMADIVTCGIGLLDAIDPGHQLHDHERLQSLLQRAATRAEQSAKAAEDLSLLALAIAALAAAVVGWFLLQTRASELSLRDDLFHQANTDLLTGLANRRRLTAVLDETREWMAAGSWVGFVTFDLDGFKDINDDLGNGAGDDLLRQVAARLEESRRRVDHLIHLGGDEFAVVLVGLESADGAMVAAGRYLELIAGPYTVGDRQEQLRLSGGVTATNQPEQVETLPLEADMAVQEAKRRGGGALLAFEPSMEAESTENGRIVRALRSADHDREFRMVYQPIVTVDRSEVLAYEALLRWTSPILGDVGPDRFIPVAERSGEICPIGKWVLEDVCRQIRTWIDLDPESQAHVSVNVSPMQLAEDGFVDCVVATLDRWGVPPHRMAIEVTESAVLDRRSGAVQRLAALREAGLKISIDDFGSGYSNLGQLLEVPFDILKIDRSLLVTLSGMREQAGGDPQGPCSIMAAIVSIASVFSAAVVCEGVETETQRISLLASGVTHVQGYLTGRPAAPEEIGPPGSRLVAV